MAPAVLEAVLVVGLEGVPAVVLVVGLEGVLPAVVLVVAAVLAEPQRAS